MPSVRERWTAAAVAVFVGLIFFRKTARPACCWDNFMPMVEGKAAHSCCTPRGSHHLDTTEGARAKLLDRQRASWSKALNPRERWTAAVCGDVRRFDFFFCQSRPVPHAICCRIFHAHHTGNAVYSCCCTARGSRHQDITEGARVKYLHRQSVVI